MGSSRPFQYLSNKLRSLKFCKGIKKLWELQSRVTILTCTMVKTKFYMQNIIWEVKYFEFNVKHGWIKIFISYPK